MLIIFQYLQFTPFDSLLYLFENPARPRPNRMLGGTNCNADMAPVRSAISVSAFSGFSLPLSAVAEGCGGADGRDGCDLLSGCDASFSKVFARRLNSFACDWEPADDLRLRPVSIKRERFPSIPSFVTAKKKFFGYICLSIRWSRLFWGLMHLRSHPSTKQEYWAMLEIIFFRALLWRHRI